MSVLSKAYFHDEAAAFAYLESVLWADGAACPHCGGTDRITKVKANPS
ncbi:MAG: transposase, partial [Sphingomicrobium sp.]